MSHVALHPAAPDTDASARHADPLARLLSGAALVAAVGGLLAIAAVSLLADAGSAPTAVPVARAPAVVWDRDPSLPDAASVLAGREPSTEEAAPTF